MAGDPTQKNIPFFDDETFEEALDAAEVFNELAAEETERLGDEGLGEEAFTDDFELPTRAAPAEPQPDETPPAVEPAPEPDPATWQSIGELFKPVVKHSPPSRIRIEANSIGTLFRRFIEQG